MMQQGKRIEEYARESKFNQANPGEGETVQEATSHKMTQSLISAIHKKNFEGYFKNNAYLRQLKTTDKKDLKIE